MGKETLDLQCEIVRIHKSDILLEEYGCRIEEIRTVQKGGQK